MPTFLEIANDIKKINILNSFERFTKSSKTNNAIIKAIQKRLFEDGITGDGIKLKTDRSGTGEVYSNYTIKLKEGSNQPDDRVTLKDTGEFYDKMVTISNQGEIIIDSDFLKDDGHMQRNFEALYGSAEKFEESVLSLTDEELIKIVVDPFIEEFIKELIG